MNLQQLAIATMSWARNEGEEKLLRLSLKQLSSLKIPVFITDGGSPEIFVTDMRRFNNFNVLQSAEKGLWAQVKISLQHASKSNASFILYTEPDKLNFFRLLPQMLTNNCPGYMLCLPLSIQIRSY